ncbi:hypothetical protein DEJ13_06460 [Curtobacterium sp. MCLR17_007]|uniref:hypothetical protein n=1 Tax=Curtobacterium sp. MCLR17_007 TaxID=2175648 RepID=UPI000DA7AD43|nr:hypothetical protein [Curtobacterium sp. MCLR17_007]WIB61468.1 hypothetical protein DEJ13_06460 [Curtobacterium sp. MCLR17_007]
MTLLDDAQTTDPPDLPDDDPPRPPHLRRADNGMSSSITLRNGQTVDLFGFAPGMTYPPNYLRDLRAGRL